MDLANVLFWVKYSLFLLLGLGLVLGGIIAFIKYMIRNIKKVDRDILIFFGVIIIIGVLLIAITVNKFAQYYDIVSKDYMFKPVAFVMGVVFLALGVNYIKEAIILNMGEKKKINGKISKITEEHHNMSVRYYIEVEYIEDSVCNIYSVKKAYKDEDRYLPGDSYVLYYNMTQKKVYSEDDRKQKYISGFGFILVGIFLTLGVFTVIP